MSKIRAIKQQSKRKPLRRINDKAVKEGSFELPDGQKIDSEHLLIQMLVPPAVKEFFRKLESEVEELCGKRHERGRHSRWGSQGGSIYLCDQKIAIEKPRVRDVENGSEVQLETYEQFQDPKLFEERVFQDGLRNVSQRKYERGVNKIASSFGFGKSTVSKHWKRVTLKRLEDIQERALGGLNIVAVMLDGKRFRKRGVVIALGISEDGKKHVLGLYEAQTESGRNCLALLNDLERRGLPPVGLLFIVDGGSGLNSALNQKYSAHKPRERKALRIRCYKHKGENIRDALGKDSPALAEVNQLFGGMRLAKDATEARSCALELEALLKRENLSALKSFQEAKPDLLLLHDLELSKQLKRFFSTTNPIENLNSLLEEDMRRVKRWRDSEHFQRWLATAVLNNEKRMRRIRGYQKLDGIAERILKLCPGAQLDEMKIAA